MNTSKFQIVDKKQGETIIGGYREYASLAGCESREGKGNCKWDKKGKRWVGGGAFSK